MISFVERFFQGGLFCVILLISAGSVAAAEDTDATAGTGTGPELVHAFGCGQCHSDDGRILLDGVPRLAGQKYRYLLHQLRLFKAGDAVYNGERIASRHHVVMNDLASRLSDAQLRTIALYYASRDCTVTATAAPSPAKAPPNIKRCETCHGGQRTNPWLGTPYLAGQDRTFLERTILRLWKSRTTSGNDTARYHRLGEVMFSDDDEPYLAAYAEYYSRLSCIKADADLNK